MSLKIGQVVTARLLLRSAVKIALDVEHSLTDLLEKQAGDIQAAQQNLDGIAQMIKAAQGSLVEIPEPPKEVSTEAKAG